MTHIEPSTAFQRSGESRQIWGQWFRYLIPNQISLIIIHIQSLCALIPSPENFAKNCQIPLPKIGVWAKRRETEGGETVGEMRERRPDADTEKPLLRFVHWKSEPRLY